MMKFKKGSKVEVMNKKEVPTSWRVAEIVSGNGHTYCVRYESYSLTKNDAVLERVSRKVIRPCPPSVQVVKKWKAGDVAEVFFDNSWKISTVFMVLEEDLYLVRPHGSIHKFNVKHGSIRMQQFWQDDRWVLIETDSEKFTNCNRTLSYQVPQLNAKINKRGGDCLPVQNDAGLPETRKRVSPLCSSLLDPYTGKAKKHRANETEQRSQIVPAQLFEKGHNWRHESCFHRSKDDSELPMAITVGQFVHPLLQIRQLVFVSQRLMFNFFLAFIYYNSGTP